ncbi:PREDICTED: uncharacterized protein LOC108776637 isoform X2 [Cyphomyrmex costatus]|uniref:uncharacterized protein LOC108776637 isoform X2 n=1 Tax=Cyphomyrmex costatus TaxID=456900 RepID=UPI0008521F95|nr:PREDICTED: uncharacterized protein LOC108776637 isoform X2 [Cyphomyrmex costatus]
MGIKSFVLFLLIAITTNASWSHRHHHHHHHHEYYPEHRKENSHINYVNQKPNFENEETVNTAQSELLKKNEKYSEVLDTKGIPFNARRLEKMLEKALLKIITGDLGAAEMLLLKSLNYTPEEVLAIRERELDKRRDEELRKMEESDGKKYYDENLYRDKAKHWNYNSMELEPSSRSDPDVDVSRNERKKNRYKGKASHDKDFDFDAYNRQAVIDYENLASKLELQQQSWSEPAANFDYEDESKNSEEQKPSQNIHQNFDRAMEPHVIFKIPYDDSELDSGSDEKSKFIDGDALVLSKGLKHRIPSTLRHTTARNVANSFHASSLSTSSSSSSSASSAATGHTPLPIVYQLRNFKGVRPDYPKNQPSFSTTEFPESIITSTIITNVTSNATSSVTDDFASSANDNKLSVKDADDVTDRKISEYEGLEWVGDDVYRVIPAFADSLGYDNTDESATTDYEEQNLGFQEGNETDTLEYQNDTPDPVKLFIANANISIENASQTANLTANQQLSGTNRDQSQKKAIDDIKSKILAITGRYNLSTNTNQVQRERLAMFSPVCHIPRNTDSEAWMDPFLMNMHFQLNLTSDDYVVAARLRLHVFSQKNTTSDFRLSSPFDVEDDDEKKIRVSVYYYTKSLKKHRSKKRLMDSVVTPLNSKGAHLALDVGQGLRFWRPSPRNPHGNGNNHGLVVQIEDQDGRPLKPALYIQQSSCVDHDFDEKAYQRIPTLFVRACHRYVRIVDDEKVTYVNCRH